MKYELPKKMLKSWITALRSNKYEQETDVLCETTNYDGLAYVRYCALGVLASDYYGIKDNDLIEENDFNMVMESTDNRLFDSLGEHSFQNWVTHMNDSKQMSFNEIADELEKNVKPT